MSSQQSPGHAGPPEPALPATARLPGATRHNALGHLIEQQFAALHAPCRSYAELERRSGVSQESLSRYITDQPHRRRSPTITTLAAIAKALDMDPGLLCRAAAMPPPARQEPLPLDQPRLQRAAPLLAQLTEEQFQALLRLVQQLLSVSASP